MARRPTTFLFVVAGTGEFPLDMLRYDSARPLTAEDKRVVDARYDDSDNSPLWDEATKHLRRNRVTLFTDSPHAPTHRRWESQTWRVVEGRRPPTVEERDAINRLRETETSR